MNKINLSLIKSDIKELSLEEVINFLLDRNVDTVINDLPSSPPYIEYDLSDLEYVRENFKTVL